MKKFVLLVAMVAFLGLAASAFGIPTAPEGDLKVVMAAGATKPAVTFSHAKHAVAVPDCKVCHHTFTGEGVPQKCSECHKAEKDGKKLDIKNAAHKTCRGCHRDMKKDGKKTGPTPCTGCHKK
ncbi:MAG: cytochrome c3 family protein [Deltaproteobacteria bacterium]|nr:cytochrome c3 family protein [Deltaproteobacteria bacterium]